jgi:hypothetical protein
MQALNRSPNPPQMRLFTNREQIKRVWEVRESSLSVVSYVPGEDLPWKDWEDSAVTPDVEVPPSSSADLPVFRLTAAKLAVQGRYNQSLCLIGFSCSLQLGRATAAL